VYYAAVAMAEAMGSSNQSQVIDLQANGGNIFTPAYAIYENGDPARIALFNFVTDPSGNSDITPTINFGGMGAPPQVKVK
jgi:hypothetical protein